MLILTPSAKIFICPTPIDMRKSFDGLSSATRFLLSSDPLSGHLFVFFNKRATMVKILWWSNGGFNIFAKRLERKSFKFIKEVDKEKSTIEVSSTELLMILDGIALLDTKKQSRWNPKSKVG